MEKVEEKTYSRIVEISGHFQPQIAKVINHKSQCDELVWIALEFSPTLWRDNIEEAELDLKRILEPVTEEKIYHYYK